jgi:hypothetical protein
MSTSIREFIPPGVFTSQDVEALVAAHLRAEAVLFSGPPTPSAHEIIATKIIAIASRGERDPIRLSDAAIGLLGGDEDFG